MTLPTDPQLTPVIRHRLRQRFPRLQDEDLPLFALPARVLVDRLVRATGATRTEVRRALYDVGALVEHRSPVRFAAPVIAVDHGEDSTGSGVPDETIQSGTAGLTPA